MRISDAARSVAVLLMVATLLPACGGSSSGAAQPSLAPPMVIERFLRAANQNDLDTMARLFGTQEGPVSELWPKKEQDDRLFLLASVLRHTDYTIGQEQIVPGRRDVATKYPVRLVINGEPVEVPFTLVRGQQHWLIEQIDTQRAMRGER